MNFHTNFCVQVDGEYVDLLKLSELHKACFVKQRDPDDESSDLVRRFFPGWHDDVRSDSITVIIHTEGGPAHIIIEDEDGSPDMEYLTTLLQAWLTILESNKVIAFEYSHNADRSTPGSFGGGAIAVSRDTIQEVDSSYLMNLMIHGRYLFLDEGVVQTREHLGMAGPGIVWSLDQNGWSAYIDHTSSLSPLYETRSRMIFNDGDQAAANKEYQLFLKEQTSEYWDCECNEGYIHPRKATGCSKCGTWQENQPDSIVGEVYKAGFEIERVDNVE